MPRGMTLAGRLAARGFADTADGQRLLADELGLDLLGRDAPIITALAAAPDPALALAGLARLLPDEQLLVALRADDGLRAGLTAVLGTSAALADHLRRHPADWRLLSDLGAGQQRGSGELRASGLAAAGPHALRIGYKRALPHIAAGDLTGATAIDAVMAGLAGPAATALQAAPGNPAGQPPS